MFARRIAILGVAAAVVAMTAFFWKNDPFTVAVLLAVDLLLGFLLLAGWRQLAQQQRDQLQIEEHQESQRRQAAESPREDRRAVATLLPPTSDDDEEDDDDDE